MKKRICVYLLLLFTIFGLVACGKDPYSKVSMTVSAKEVNLLLGTEDGEDQGKSKDITVTVDVPKSLSDDIVLPKYGDRYGDEYVSITIDKKENGDYVLTFTGEKTGVTEIPIKTKDGNVTKIVKVKVDIGVKSMSFRNDLKTLVVEAGGKLDFNGNPRNYISFNPSNTSQTDVVYAIHESTTAIPGSAEIKNNVLRVKKDFDTTKTLYVYAYSENNENVYTTTESGGTTSMQSIQIVVIQPFSFLDNGAEEGKETIDDVSNLNASLVIPTAGADVNAISMNPRTIPTKKANSIYYDLVFAEPNLASGELTNSTAPSYMFGARLNLSLPHHKDYKISMDSVDSSIVDISALGQTLDGGVSIYGYQIIPKSAGKETFAFKIDYLGPRDESDNSYPYAGRYDGEFTRYIYVTISVEKLTTATNLEINEEKYSSSNQLMVFTTYMTSLGTAIKVYDKNATNMTFTVSDFTDFEIFTAAGEKITESNSFPNNTTLFIKAKENAKDGEIKLTIKTLLAVPLNYQIDGKSSYNLSKVTIEYSKQIKLGIKVLSDELDMSNLKDKQYIIENSESLTPQLLYEFLDEKIDAKAIIAQTRITNVDSGKITFGTGNDKNKIYFTPNFQLSKDFYVSDTNVEFEMINGISRGCQIKVDLKYITDENGAPKLLYDIDRSNGGYFVSWNGNGTEGETGLTLEDFAKEFKYGNKNRKEPYETYNSGVGTSEDYLFFTHLVLATNTEITFVVYKLFSFNGRIEKVSANDGVTIKTDNSYSSWNSRRGGVLYITGNSTTSVEEGGVITPTSLTISYTYTKDNGETQEELTGTNTIKLYVFDKIKSAKLTTNSYSVFDATNLKDMDIDASFAKTDLEIVTEGQTDKNVIENVKNKGEITYGNLYQHYVMSDPNFIILYIANKEIRIPRGSLINGIAYDAGSKKFLEGETVESGTLINFVKYNDKNYYKVYIDQTYWFDSLSDAYGVLTAKADDNKKTDDYLNNAIKDTELINILESLHTSSVYVFQAKLDMSRIQISGATVETEEVLNAIYADGSVEVVYTGVIKQFFNSFESNFTIKIFNPTKSQTIKSNVDKDMGLYFEVDKMKKDPKNATTSFTYYITPVNTYNKNIFVYIEDISSKKPVVVDFKSGLKSGNYDTVGNFMDGITATENAKFKVVVDETKGSITITYLKSADGEYLAGKFLCRLVLLDQVSNGDINKAYSYDFNIAIADGSEEFKYQIRSKSDFVDYLNNISGAVNKYYELATDLVMNSTFDKGYELYNNLSGRREIVRTSDNSGKTEIVEKYYSIYGLKLVFNDKYASTNIGLFSTVEAEGLTLEYIKLENVSMTVTLNATQAYNIGVLIGEAKNGISIIGCRVNGALSVVQTVASGSGAGFNIGGMIGAITGATVITDAPSDSVVNNSNINSNISINVEVDKKNVHAFNVGGVVGLIASSDANEVSINKVNVIANIRVLSFELQGNEGTQVKNIIDLYENVNVGGVAGKVLKASINDVTIYPVLVAYKNVGGVVGHIVDGNIVNARVQMLYNLNMKNIIAGYMNVAGLVGYAQPTSNSKLTIDYSYVRSYTSSTINSYDGSALSIVKAMKDKYFGAIVVLLNNNIAIGTPQYVGGLVGYVTTSPSVIENELPEGTMFSITLSNCYFNSDISSNANPKNEIVGGFMGYKKEVAEDSGSLDRSIFATLSNCYFDGNVNMNGIFKLVYGNMGDDKVSDSTTVYAGEPSTFTYSNIIGDAGLTRNGSRIIVKQTEVTKSVLIRKEAVKNISANKIYAKINGTMFGLTETADSVTPIIYTGLTTKVIETNILVFRDGADEGTYNLYMSAYRREFESSPTGNKYSFYNMQHTYNQTGSNESDLYKDFASLPVSTLHDLIGYGFVSKQVRLVNKVSDENTISAISRYFKVATPIPTSQDASILSVTINNTTLDDIGDESLKTTLESYIGRTIYTSDMTNFYAGLAYNNVVYNVGYNGQGFSNEELQISNLSKFANILSVFTNIASNEIEDQFRYVNTNNVTTQEFNRENETKVTYNKTIEGSYIGFLEDVVGENNLRYGVASFEINNETYYVNTTSNDTSNILFKSYTPGGSNNLAVTTAIPQQWLVSLPTKHKIGLKEEYYKDFSISLEVQPLSIDGNRIRTLYFYGAENKEGELYAYAYNKDDKTEQKVYVFHGMFASKNTSTQLTGAPNSDGVSTVYEKLLDYTFYVSGSTEENYLYYTGDYELIYASYPYSGTASGGGTYITYYTEKPTMALQDAVSTKKADECFIQIGNKEYKLKNGALVNKEDDFDEFTPQMGERYYIQDELSANEDNKILSNSKILSIYETLFATDEYKKAMNYYTDDDGKTWYDKFLVSLVSGDVIQDYAEPIEVKEPTKPIMPNKDGVSNQEEYYRALEEYKYKKESYVEDSRKYADYKIAKAEYEKNKTKLDELRANVEFKDNIYISHLNNDTTIYYSVDKNVWTTIRILKQPTLPSNPTEDVQKEYKAIYEDFAKKTDGFSNNAKVFLGNIYYVTDGDQKYYSKINSDGTFTEWYKDYEIILGWDETSNLGNPVLPNVSERLTPLQDGLKLLADDVKQLNILDNIRYLFALYGFKNFNGEINAVFDFDTRYFFSVFNESAWSEELTYELKSESKLSDDALSATISETNAEGETVEKTLAEKLKELLDDEASDNRVVLTANNGDIKFTFDNLYCVSYDEKYYYTNDKGTTWYSEVTFKIGETTTNAQISSIIKDNIHYSLAISNVAQDNEIKINVVEYIANENIKYDFVVGFNEEDDSWYFGGIQVDDSDLISQLDTKRAEQGKTVIELNGESYKYENGFWYSLGTKITDDYLIEYFETNQIRELTKNFYTNDGGNTWFYDEKNVGKILTDVVVDEQTKAKLNEATKKDFNEFEEIYYKSKTTTNPTTGAITTTSIYSLDGENWYTGFKLHSEAQEKASFSGNKISAEDISQYIDYNIQLGIFVKNADDTVTLNNITYSYKDNAWKRNTSKDATEEDEKWVKAGVEAIVRSTIRKVGGTKSVYYIYIDNGEKNGEKIFYSLYSPNNESEIGGDWNTSYKVSLYKVEMFNKVSDADVAGYGATVNSIIKYATLDGENYYTDGKDWYKTLNLVTDSSSLAQLEQIDTKDYEDKDGVDYTQLKFYLHNSWYLDSNLTRKVEDIELIKRLNSEKPSDFNENTLTIVDRYYLNDGVWTDKENNVVDNIDLIKILETLPIQGVDTKYVDYKRVFYFTEWWEDVYGNVVENVTISNSDFTRLISKKEITLYQNTNSKGETKWYYEDSYTNEVKENAIIGTKDANGRTIKEGIIKRSKNLNISFTLVFGDDTYVVMVEDSTTLQVINPLINSNLGNALREFKQEVTNEDLIDKLNKIYAKDPTKTEVEDEDGNVYEREDKGEIKWYLKLSIIDPYYRVKDNILTIYYKKDGIEITFMSIPLSKGSSAYEWAITNKINNGMPVMVKPYLNSKDGTSKTGAPVRYYEGEYRLWYDTLATLSLTVNDFMSNKNGYYYEEDGIQYQGHIMQSGDTVVLMYNEPVSGTASQDLNIYKLSYGITESGYFVASINGKVLEVSGLKIDIESASQIVVTSSNIDVVSVNAVNNYIQLIVNGTGESELAFYNLKDDGICVKLQVKVIKGFSDFEIVPDSEKNILDEKDNVSVALNVGVAKDYKIGFVNKLNNNVYLSNTSGYQITVVSVDGKTNTISENYSSVKIGSYLIGGDTIGGTFDYSYLSSVSMVAVNRATAIASDDNDQLGVIRLTVVPYVLVDGEKIFIYSLSKNVTITIYAPAVSVAFGENKANILADNTKDVAVVIVSNNISGYQNLHLYINGIEHIVFNPRETKLYPTTNLVNASALSLLSVRVKSYAFEESTDIVGNARLHKHIFLLNVGLNVSNFLEQYNSGTNPLANNQEFELIATGDEPLNGDTNSTTIKSQFDLTIMPNVVGTIDTYFYPKLNNSTSGDQYSQANIWAIAPGKSGVSSMGILKIETAPEYNNVLIAEIVLNNQYLKHINVTQCIPVYEMSDTYTKYENLSTSNTFVGNRLILWNTVIDYSKIVSPESSSEESSTQGEYYLRFEFKDTMPQSVNFPITINLYDKNRELIMSKTDQLYIEKLPVLNVTSNGNNNLIVGKGEIIPVNIVAEDVTSDITWNMVNGSETIIREGMLYYVNGNKKVTVGRDDSINPNYNYYINTINLNYGVHELKLSGSKEINNTVYNVESVLRFNVVKFSIEGISEIDAIDNVVNIMNGTTKTFKADVEINKGAKDILANPSHTSYAEIKTAFDNMVEEISVLNTKTALPYLSNWSYQSGSDSWVTLGIKNMQELDNGVAHNGFMFVVDTFNNYKCSIRAQLISSINFRLGVHYYYDEEGDVHVVPNDVMGVYTDSAGVNHDVYIIEYNFTVNINDNSTEDHPNPINTADEFKSMQKGVSYILQKDIELVNWAPLNFDANYLDGNGFTIQLKSFDLSEERTKNEAYAGLFRTIAEGSTIKNLNIDISGLLRTTSEVNLMLKEQRIPNIDLRKVSVVYFGVLAGQNDGVVENVKVVNYGINGEKVLYVATTLGFYQVGEDSTTTTGHIGGLVGVNGGVIADSMVGVRNTKTVTISAYVNSKLTQRSQSTQSFTLMGGNNIAGLSAQNTGTISNSFTGKLSITNTTNISVSSMTAGFVCQNSGKIYSCAVTTPDSDIVKLRSDSTIIKSSTTTAGFVHNNAGVIEDCYTNIQIENYNVATAGFVYKNEEGASIVNAYTTTRNVAIDKNSKSHGLFVFEKPMYGTLLNAYYAIVDNELGLNIDTGEEGTNEAQMELLKSLDPAIGLSVNSTDVVSKTYFDGFTFASDSSSMDGIWLYNESTFPSLANCESVELYTCRDMASAPAANFLIDLVNNKVYVYNTSFQRTDSVFNIADNKFNYYGIDFEYKLGVWTYRSKIDNSLVVLQGVEYEGVRYYEYKDLNSEANGTTTMFNYTYIANNPGSQKNPLLVSTAEEFSKYIISYTNKKKVGGEVKYVFGGNSDSDSSIARYVKLVQDLDFSDNVISKKYKINNGTDMISVTDIVFNGVLLGNSMSLSNIYLTRLEKTENENWGIFAQVGDVKVKETDRNAFVFNLKLNYREVSSENSMKVGVLAGTIVNSTIAKIQIMGPGGDNETDIVKGKYLVGGLAGIIYGNDTQISEVTTSDVRIMAGYTSSHNGETFGLTDKSTPSTTDYNEFTYQDDNGMPHKSVLDVKKITDYSATAVSGLNMSYAGAIAGVVVGSSNNSFEDIKIYKNGEEDATYVDIRKASASIQNLIVKNGLEVNAMISGGMFGYLGGVEPTAADTSKQTGVNNGLMVVKDLYLELNNELDQSIYGRAYSGGIAGYMYNSVMVESRVEHEESVQDEIDVLINNVDSSKISNNTLFLSGIGGGNANRNIAIGGLAGATRQAYIIDSLSKVNVVNNYSFIAGGLVGKSDEMLYMAFDYTTGNVEADTMIGGLIGYKTYSGKDKTIGGGSGTKTTEYTQDLYLYNCFGLNVWSTNILAYVKEIHADAFKNLAVDVMAEVGNQKPVDVDFAHTEGGAKIRYIGSAVGRMSKISSTPLDGETSLVSFKEEYSTVFGEASPLDDTSLFEELTAGERKTAVAGQTGSAGEESYYTYFNNHFFNVITTTYGKVTHSGNMSLGTYVSKFGADSLELINNDHTIREEKVEYYKAHLGKQEYISQITGDYINLIPQSDANGNILNGNYRNEFSKNWGFTMDASQIADVKTMFDGTAGSTSGIKPSTTWYVESTKYLAKHGYNLNSNIKKVQSFAGLQEAFTFGYTDKIYNIIKINSSDDGGYFVSPNTYLSAPNEDISIANNVYIYQDETDPEKRIQLKFGLKYNSRSNKRDKNGFYSIISGCTFTNIDFVLDVKDVDINTLSTTNTSGYLGLFANEIIGCSFVNCKFTINLPAELNLASEVSGFGLLAGRLTRVVFSGCEVQIASSTKINASDIVELGGVAAKSLYSTLDNVAINLNSVTFIATTSAQQAVSVGLVAGVAEAGNFNKLVVNQATARLELSCASKSVKNVDFGVFGYVKGHQEITNTLIDNVNLIITNIATAGEGKLPTNLNFGLLAGRIANSSLKVVKIYNTTGDGGTSLNYESQDWCSNENIGLVAGESEGCTLNGVYTYKDVDNISSPLRYKAYASDAKNLRSINVGGIIGNSISDSLRNVVSVVKINIVIPSLSKFAKDSLNVGGIIGIATGANGSITNSVNVNDINIDNFPVIPTAIGGIYGNCGAITMEGVISYGDIIYMDKNIYTASYEKATVTVKEKEGTYYRINGQWYEMNTATGRPLDKPSDKDIVTELNKNSTVKEQITYYFNYAETSPTGWYTDVDCKNKVYSGGASVLKQILTVLYDEEGKKGMTAVLKSNDYYIGGVIGRTSNTSSRFTNVLGMTNFIDNSTLSKYKIVKNIGGFTYKLNDGPQFINSYYITEFDPVNASGSDGGALYNKYLDYAEIPSLEGFKLSSYGTQNYLPMPLSDDDESIKFVAENEFKAIITKANSALTSAGSKLNPTIASKYSGGDNFGDRKYFVFDGGVEFGSTGVSIGKGSVFTSKYKTGEDYYAVVSTNPFWNNFGTISNLLVKYKETINISELLMRGTNTGYIYNVLVASEFKDSEKTDRTIKASKPFVIINQNDGGIYKTGVSIVLSKDSDFVTTGSSKTFGGMVRENYGTIKECYVTSVYDWVLHEKIKRTYRYGAIAIYNSKGGVIKNCFVGGRFGEYYATQTASPEKGYKKQYENGIEHTYKVGITLENYGTVSNVLSSNGDMSKLNFKSLNSEIWETNLRVNVNDGYPYIKDLMRVSTNTYGGKLVSIPNVQELRNFLSALNAFTGEYKSLNQNPEEKAITSIKSGQKIDFAITTGGEIKETFELNNSGYVIGFINGLKLQHALINNNMGEINNITFTSCTSKKKAIVCNLNNRNIIDVKVTSCTVTGDTNSNAGIIAVQNSFAIFNPTVSGCTINNGYCVGGVAGYNERDIYGKVTVENTTLNGSGDVGGVVGYTTGGLGLSTESTPTKISVKDCTISSTTGSSAGGVAGFSTVFKEEAGIVGGSINVSGGKINSKSMFVGGVFGYIDNTINITEIKTTIDINASEANAYSDLSVGGAIGYRAGVRQITSKISVGDKENSDKVSITINQNSNTSTYNPPEYSIGGLIGRLEAFNKTNDWTAYTYISLGKALNYYVGGGIGYLNTEYVDGVYRYKRIKTFGYGKIIVSGSEINASGYVHNINNDNKDYFFQRLKQNPFQANPGSWDYLMNGWRLGWNYYSIKSDVFSSLFTAFPSDFAKYGGLNSVQGRYVGLDTISVRTDVGNMSYDTVEYGYYKYANLAQKLKDDYKVNISYDFSACSEKLGFEWKEQDKDVVLFGLIRGFKEDVTGDVINCKLNLQNRQVTITNLKAKAALIETYVTPAAKKSEESNISIRYVLRDNISLTAHLPSDKPFTENLCADAESYYLYEFSDTDTQRKNSVKWIGKDEYYYVISSWNVWNWDDLTLAVNYLVDAIRIQKALVRGYDNINITAEHIDYDKWSKNTYRPDGKSDYGYLEETL